MQIEAIETIVLRIPCSSGGSTNTAVGGGKSWLTADSLLVKTMPGMSHASTTAR
jgi:hypothetical protein